MKAAVLTISDRVSRGVVDDTSGELLDELLHADGYDVERRVVPDEAPEIAASIEELAERSAVVLTTGGTGPIRESPPKRRESSNAGPGPEALRADSSRKRCTVASRGVAGVVGRTFLPGSPGGCRDGYALPHWATPCHRRRADAARANFHVMRIARLYYRLSSSDHMRARSPTSGGARRGRYPSGHDLPLITVALTAMALNRLDASAANPRTATRELPSGALGRSRSVWHRSSSISGGLAPILCEAAARSR
jgi:molybdenum cofactor synthesis domain-containing protein